MSLRQTHVRYTCVNPSCYYRYPLYVKPEAYDEDELFQCECCDMPMVPNVQIDLEELLFTLGIGYDSMT